MDALEREEIEFVDWELEHEVEEKGAGIQLSYYYVETYVDSETGIWYVVSKPIDKTQFLPESEYDGLRKLPCSLSQRQRGGQSYSLGYTARTTGDENSRVVETSPPYDGFMQDRYGSSR